MKKRIRLYLFVAAAILIALVFIQRSDEKDSRAVDDASELNEQVPIDTPETAAHQVQQTERTHTDAETASASQSTDQAEVEPADAVSPPNWRPAAVFADVMRPLPQRQYPRGENNTRRYHEPASRSLAPTEANGTPLPLAASPADGRFHLYDQEIDDHTLRAGRLVFNSAALDQVVAGQRSTILAPTLGDEVLTLVFESVRTRSAQTHTLQGHVVGEESSSTVQMVFHDGILHANVMRYDVQQEFEYRIMPDGYMMVRELDQKSLHAETCANCDGYHDHDALAYEADIEAEITAAVAASAPQDGEGGIVVQDTSGWRTIDVTVGYSKQARMDDGGTPQIEARIIASVDRMTAAFANSAITNTEMMLLGTIEEPDYVEPGTLADLGDELTNLRREDDGVLDVVTDFNNRLGGDLVTFVTTAAQSGQSGVANSNNRYAIVSRLSMTASGLTYAHELGHNLNAQHAWGDTGLTTSANTGWRFIGLGGGDYRTIMAYDGNWARIPYYSNPNVSYDGIPTGAVDGYDATGNTNVDQRLVSGGLIFSATDKGFDGNTPTLGANNADTIDTGGGDPNAGATPASAYATRSAFAIINPLAGARWEKGATQVIQFTGGDMKDLATIALYKGGILQTNLATNLNPVTARDIAWVPPFDLPDGSNYMIRVELDRNGSTLFADSGIFEIFSSLPHVTATSAPAVPAGIGTISQLAFTFNVPMNPASFSQTNDIVAFTDPIGGSVLGIITNSFWSNGDTVLTMQFTPPTQPGTYQMIIGPDIEDSNGNAMDQDVDGVAGEIIQDRFTVVLEINPPLAYYASMDTDPGWTFSTNNPVDGWAFGQPTGGGANPYAPNDPTSGYNGPNVVGYNLNGDYAKGISEIHWATTPAIDCSNHENVRLRFQRWLGVYYYDFGDRVYIEVSNDGLNWTTIWQNPGTYKTLDENWIEVEYDISAVADGQSTVYVRWGLGPTDSSYNDDACGWNIDEVILFGDYLDTTDFTPPDPDPMGFASAPVAQGTNIVVMTAVAALDFNGVEYYFTETSANPGGADSGWQGSPGYTNSGLMAGVQYSYSVKARDKSANRNETAPSPVISATTAGSNTVPVVEAGANESAALNPSNLWTPAEIATAGWYDASDTSTITQVTGAVSQWDDKSTNNLHATQGNSSLRPTSGTRTINNKNIIGFAKSGDQAMNIPTLDVIAKEVWSVFILDDYTNTASHLIVGGGDNVQVGVNSGTQKLRLWASTNPYSADSASSATIAEDVAVMVGWLAHTNTKKYVVNGSVEIPGDNYTSGSMNVSSIGRGTFTSMDGAIGELVVTGAELSISDREKLEGYLAHKWGLAANLPENHNYKHAPPGGANVIVNLAGTVTDEDGQLPDTIWTKVSGPGFVSFADATATNTTASFIEAGEYVLRLSADDGTHQVFDELTITITVTGPLPDTFSVNYNGNGSDGGTVPVDASSPYTNGATVTVLGNTGSLVRTGYTFTNWNTVANGFGTSYASNDTFSIASNTTLYAQWTPNMYTVTFDKQGGSGGSNSVSATYGSAMPVATAPTRSGYNFGGYYTATNGSGTQYYTDAMASASNWDMASDTTLYADWSLMPVSVVTDLNTVNVPEGDTNTFLVKLSHQPAGAVTVTVSRTAGDADISVQSGSNLTFTTGNWDTYQTVTLAAANDADAANSSATITCDASDAAYIDKNITANEIDKHTTLTVSTDGNGTTVPPGAVIVEKSVATNITATANEGYNFANWSVTSGISTIADTNAASTTVSIDAAASIRANFVLKTYAVSYNGNGNTGGTAPASQIKTNGVSLALATNSGSLSRTGYAFSGWNTATNGSGIGYAAGGNYTNNAAVTLYAAWSLIPPAAPTGLSAAASIGQVALSWTSVSNAASYRVKRSSTAGGSYSQVGTPSGTNFSDSVANGATYYYVVSAVNAGGESPDSAEVSAKLLHIVPFADDFEARTIGDLDGQNGWAASNAVVQTNLTFAGTQASKITSEVGYLEQTFAGSESNAWTDMQMQPVFCPETPSSFDPTATAVFFFNTNGNPVVFSSTNVQVVSAVTVSTGDWVRVTVYADYTTRKWNFYIDGAPVASGLDFYDAANTRYERLTFSGGGPSGAFLDDITVGTSSPLGGVLISAPSALSATAISSGQMDLSWTDNSTNETGFAIERSSTSGSGFATIGETNVTTYSDTTVVPGATYYYRVIATNAVTSSAASAEASATTPKAAVTVTLDTLTQTYDGTPREVTYTTDPTNLTVEVTYAGNAWAPTNAGSYAVVATIVDSTYAGSTNGTLVVAKATPTVAPWPTASPIVLGQALSASTLSNGTASVTGSFAFTSPATVPATGGVYTAAVTFTPEDTTNYTTVAGSSSVDVLLTVTFVTDGTVGASLTGNTNQTVTYGADSTAVTANAPVDYPFVNWTRGGVEYGTNAQITATNVTADMTLVANFALNNTLVITAASATKVYDGTALTTNGYELTSGTLLDGHTLVSVTVSGSQTVAGSSSNVPSAALIQDTGTNDVTDQYTITYANGSLTVDPSTLTVTPDAGLFKVYGEVDPALAYTNTGAVASETADFSGTLARAAGEDVGTYAITVGTLALADNTPFLAANYTLSLTAGVTFEITQATPTVFAWPTASPILLGQTFSASTLSNGTASVDGSFAFTNPNTEPAEGGTNVASVTFTPTDTTNYTTVAGSVDVWVDASVVLPFSEDFEGLVLGELNGQSNWLASGAVVQTNLVYEGLQAAEIAGEGYVQRAFTDAQTNVWTDFRFQPAFFDGEPSNLDADSTAVFYFNTNGHPVVYDGLTPVVVSNVTVTTGEWVRVTVHSDYAAKTWSLHINGALQKSDLGFYDATATHYTTFSVKGAGTATVPVDALLIDLASPFAGLPLLTVTSAHGFPSPAVGAASYAVDSQINAYMPDTIITNGLIRYVCTGWTGTGNAPASGSGTNFSFVINQDSSITWQWQTNYWVTLEVVGE